MLLTDTTRTARAQSTSAYPVSAAARRRLMLPLLLVLLFSFAQSATLLHNHEGDLALQYDCGLCVHAGSGAHGLAAQYSLHLPEGRTWYLSASRSENPFLIVRSANARAPPHLRQS
jgi:hypothetical protein